MPIEIVIFKKPVLETEITELLNGMPGQLESYIAENDVIRVRSEVLTNMSIDYMIDGHTHTLFFQMQDERTGFVMLLPGYLKQHATRFKRHPMIGRPLLLSTQENQLIDVYIGYYYN